MGYDSLSGKTDEYVKDKAAHNEKIEAFSIERKKFDDVLGDAGKLDDDIQSGINDIAKEFDAEKEILDEQQTELDGRRKSLADSIDLELNKLNDAKGRFDALSRINYTGGTEKASVKCKDYIAQLEDLLNLVNDESDSKSSIIGADYSSNSKGYDESFFFRNMDTPKNPGGFNLDNKRLSNNFSVNMDKVLSRSLHSDVRRTYNKYAAKLSVANSNYKGGAFYRCGEGVYMDAEQVANGDIIHKPYQTAFHEFGHNIDYLMGGGMPISETYENGALLMAIKEDFDELKGNMTDADLIRNLRQEMTNNGWSVMDTASVSDMLECLTGISYPLGAGHGADYWVNPTRLPCKEFFAEMLDGSAANEESYLMMKRFFPRGVEMVHKILEENFND